MFFRCQSNAEAVATAVLNGRFALYDPPFKELEEFSLRGYFSNIKSPDDFAIFSKKPESIGTVVKRRDGQDFGLVYSFDEMAHYDFKSCIILSETAPNKCFEEVVSLAKVPPNHIYIPQPAWQNRSYRSDNILDDILANEVPERSHEGLSSKELLSHIVDCFIQIKRQDIPGDIINLGVYKGWSMQFLAALRDAVGLKDRLIRGFDTFFGFTYTSSSIMDSFVSHSKTRFGNLTITNSDTSLELVQNLLSPLSNIELIDGDIRHRVKDLGQRPIAFALFDMDDYSPTKCALNKVYENLSPNGFIAHDHFSFPSCGNPGLFGQRQAMLEFLEKQPMFNLAGTNIFMKTGR